MLRRTAVAAMLLVLVPPCVLDAQEYFPPGVFREDKEADAFVADWYSEQLRALEEPSLWKLSKIPDVQMYRFTWLRTFHNPVAVRLEVMKHGSGRLCVKKTSGAGGYDPGRLVRDDTIILSAADTSAVIGKISDCGFWRMPLRTEIGGCDGAEWILEGVKDGQYHLVDRWCPRDHGKDQAFRKACLYLLDLGNVKEKDVY